ncbi:MAG: PTS sugar transporter subunit IIC [Erysipelotrichaceae bacterium]|nr:PTS sugar transporter subunit IIC [Erysipelotrichaceae bacterium]
MKKIIDWMNEKVAPKTKALSENPWISAVQETMVSTMPVMVISSFITILSIVKDYVPSFPDLSYLSQFTMGLSALMVAYLIPSVLLEKMELSKYRRQAGFMGVSLLLAMSKAGIDENGMFSVDPQRIGASGMFVAIVAGLYVAFIMKLFSSRSMFSENTKMPSFLVNSFDSMAPILLVALTAFLLCEVLGLDLYAIVNTILSPLVNIAQSLFGFVFISFLMAFFYSFGMSPWFLTPVYYTVGMDAIAKNAAAVAAGGKATLILSNETFGGWIWLGGTGCTLTLCFLLLLCKSEKLRGLGKTCIVPAVFNINEPIVYGAIVFNPLLMIPMWINPTLVAIITYLVMKAGLVDIPSSSFLLWYIPIPILTYLTNHDFRGVILVLALLLITALIWYPFLMAYDRQCLAEENKDKNKTE